MADYDAFADAFDDHAKASAYNAHYDRPAVLELLGPVTGLRVLDAGCGSGLYAAELVSRGAEVVGVDASAKLIHIARIRSSPSAEFRVHDLTTPLDWIPDAHFQRVVMALVLHHLEDPVPTLRELHRVLEDGGVMVVSTVHPTADWLRLGGSYFAKGMVSETWNEGWPVAFRRAPLATIVSEFSRAGFAIEELIEPQPAESMRRDYPEVFAKLSVEPVFIAFRLLKR